VPVALLSVWDKTGIVDLAAGLVDEGWQILSSGGTAAAIAEAGIAVRDVADLTGVPAILGHRVVTLHPRVHGGILADLADESHRADMDAHGIGPIDLVVVNLYPFASSPAIDTIDVGGPAMVRAAAKNHSRVGVVVDPADYGMVLEAIRTDGWDGSLRKHLAHKAFRITSAYDAAIASWLGADDISSPTDAVLPPVMTIVAERDEVLRYGENPHQVAARYRLPGVRGWWEDALQLNGKEMSYLNVLDADAAWRLANAFDGPAAVVVKHANPCGVAVADDAHEAYRRAHAADPVSAFGGIVAVNREIDLDTARSIAEVFTEVVVAPSFTAEALDVLSDKPNLRVLEAPPPAGQWPLEVRSLDGALLVQTLDAPSLGGDATLDDAKVVSSRTPTDAESADLRLAWTVVAATWSNAIVVARDGVAIGIGGGQPNRVDAARIALSRAGEAARGAVAASDAFFPFRDTVDELARAGVTAVIQPGGSVRDAESVAAADEHSMAMVLTGIRHFRH
jgi:phosphoribosylaminoimidazolecarboxamide formyltransferase/IMP cyclohydrolase